MKKAISNEEMAKYISYLFKTVRIPHNTNDTIGSPLVKENSNAVPCVQPEGKTSSCAKRPKGRDR